MKRMLRGSIGLTVVAALIVMLSSNAAGQKQDGFRFRSGIDLVNVTATVTDTSGRFVPGLRQDDFIVYEENELQEVTHFSNERVPVSVGIVLDTSGSMVGEKITNALMAIDRFLTKLLAPEDEVFLYKFSNFPELVLDWTTDRQRLSRAIRRINPGGGTAMYDAVIKSVPLAQTGQHRKRAIVLISDGVDTDSQGSLAEAKQLIRESEVMVYAIAVDAQGETTFGAPSQFQSPFPPTQRRTRVRRSGYDFDAHALREITDDSGGRTEVVRSGPDLDPATANIADELSRQYYIGYASTTKKDGRWHAIRVEARDKSLRVRARRGYIATP